MEYYQNHGICLRTVFKNSSVMFSRIIVLLGSWEVGKLGTWNFLNLFSVFPNILKIMFIYSILFSIILHIYAIIF